MAKKKKYATSLTPKLLFLKNKLPEVVQEPSSHIEINIPRGEWLLYET